MGRSSDSHAVVSSAANQNMFEEDLVHRSLMSSKKASAATLSTGIPGTDSAATLRSSQKSLPPAVPTLPPLPILQGFPPNRRPPMIGGASVIIPPEWRRLPGS